ncbi:MAG: polymer-forming cytoskeletal protein [Flavobacteriaceae bacterium]|jgi:cytoskeletal protein CcmA (bactofilin family)|nr:polymer-forming cytoskeletal protein [Flavobacteriaceae bacterium]
MFSENKKGQDQGSQPNRIEANTHIKGDISSQADFRIDGVLEGNLTTTGKVVIGASGKITGNVSCVQADIAGGFEGELEVAELLNLQETAKIEGQIYTQKLAISPGAVFNAKCSMRPKGVSALHPDAKTPQQQGASIAKNG